MKAKIIRHKPCLRKFDEVEYAGGGSEKMLVMFTGNSRQSWIGQFVKGDNQGLCKVLTCSDSPFSLVVAGGKGYFVNIDKKEIKRFPDDGKTILSAVKSGRPECCIAGTETSLCIIDHEGTFHEIVPEFDVEGFYLNEKEKSKVCGNLMSEINLCEKEIPFRIDLDSLILHVEY